MNYHVPVLVDEIIGFVKEYLELDLIHKNKKILIVDGTTGDGGHTLALVKLLIEATSIDTFISNVNFICIDKDHFMLERAKNRIKEYLENLENIEDLEDLKNLENLKNQENLKNLEKQENLKLLEKNNNLELINNFKFIHSSYHNLKEILIKENKKADFVLLDLGTSTYHLKYAGRGFSFNDEKLDMRFDTSSGPSTFELINFYSEKEIANILKVYGEEEHSGRIAKNIVKIRPIKTARELANCIIEAKGGKNLKTKKLNNNSFINISNATKSFQAFRIATNMELELISEFLNNINYYLNKGGLLAIISFHSLEDRLVKNAFKNIGVKFNKKNVSNAEFVILTPKGVRTSEEEININPASRSAVLRVIYAHFP